jgi:hypothetical protein
VLSLPYTPYITAGFEPGSLFLRRMRCPVRHADAPGLSIFSQHRNTADHKKHNFLHLLQGKTFHILIPPENIWDRCYNFEHIFAKNLAIFAQDFASLHM